MADEWAQDVREKEREGALGWARSRPCGVGGGVGLRTRKMERGRFSFCVFLF